MAVARLLRGKKASLELVYIREAVLACRRSHFIFLGFRTVSQISLEHGCTWNYNVIAITDMWLRAGRDACLMFFGIEVPDITKQNAKEEEGNLQYCYGRTGWHYSEGLSAGII